MTLVANGANSRRPGRAASHARVLLILGALALTIAQYIAAILFLWSIKGDVRDASVLTVARYVYYYGERPDIAQRLRWATAIGCILVTLATLPAILPRQRALHGSAKFATEREMERAGLFASDGFYLGRFRSLFRWRDIILGGQQGVLLSAPPRSDKGTAIVVPTLLSWRGSVICLDVKRENWTLTAGYRRQLGEVYLLDPLSVTGDTACWSPLYYVSSESTLRINDVQEIGATLYPDIPGTDPFWTASARSLFLGVTLYVLETPSLPPTLGEVLRQGMASDSEGFSHHWKRIIEGRQAGPFPLSSQCVRALYDVIDLAPVTASSIRKTFTSRLDLLANPLVDRATSRNDFDLRELRRRPMSIYIGIRPADLHRLQPLLNLFIQQAIALQTRTLPEHDPTLKHQLAMILDEAPAAGRVPILAESIAYTPGYNVRVMLVVQAISQLRDVYGQQTAETMMKSLAVRVAYAPKDFGEANELSQELGNTTVAVKTISRPQWDVGGERGRRSRSVSISQQKRPLLLPQEVREIGRDRELLLYEGLRPVLAHKNRYFQDKRFRARLMPPPASAAPAAVPSAPIPDVVGESVAPSADFAAEKPRRSEAPDMQLDMQLDIPVREATIDDIARIDSLTLDDFAVDWSRVHLPQKAEGERLTSEELQQAVDSFLSTMRER